MPTDQELIPHFKVFLTYLLNERQEETEVRGAFAVLVQERHANFHCPEGQETQFTECSNAACIQALKILQAARKPRVEINDLSLELVKMYNLKLKVDGVTRTASAYLEDKGAILPPDEKDLTV